MLCREFADWQALLLLTMFSLIHVANIPGPPAYAADPFLERNGESGFRRCSWLFLVSNAGPGLPPFPALKVISAVGPGATNLSAMGLGVCGEDAEGLRRKMQGPQERCTTALTPLLMVNSGQWYRSVKTMHITAGDAATRLLRTTCLTCASGPIAKLRSLLGMGWSQQSRRFHSEPETDRSWRNGRVGVEKGTKRVISGNFRLRRRTKTQ